MEVLIPCCAGADVHKKTITVCVLWVNEEGKVEKWTRTFKTMTRDLLELRAWLAERRVTHVAMESTGVWWKPVYNILEGDFEVLLCNAKHIKNVPGRKTDVKDSEWIAQLLQHGLLEGSFVPPRAQRDLRDLTRHYAQLGSEKAREVNRIHKVLEDANIKLSSVATDILGKSGRDILRALIEGKRSPNEMAELARRRMRNKIPELRIALQGHVTDHHRYLLELHFKHVEYLEGLLEQLTGRIEALLTSGRLESSEGDEEERESGEPPLSYPEAIGLLDEIPGIDVLSAVQILAEIGTNMGQFASEKHLASWAHLCPGTRESAGKHGSGKTGKGNRWLGRSLTQVAWAASRTKGTYLSAQFRRIAKRRGKKRAIVAVSHSILVIIYHMLKYHLHFAELGADYFDRIDPDRITRYHKKRLESLGFAVTLEKLPKVA